MKKIWYAPYQFESYGEEEIRAVEKSLRSGWLGGQGPKSQEFEKVIAKWFLVRSSSWHDHRRC